jgi:hypothetical protein
MDSPILLLALLLLMNKKVSTSQQETPTDDKCHPRHAEKGPLLASQQPSALLKRATSRRALEWVNDLRAHGASPAEAAGIARWIGIESGGNPTAESRIGERGLLQATRTTALKDGLFTPAEWDALISPGTSRAEHARLALKQYRWHVERARKWVVNPPPVSDVASWLAYAKMHHSRPCDLQFDRVHGPADKMIADLAARYQGKYPHRIKRLNVAAIVGYGRVASDNLTS